MSDEEATLSYEDARAQLIEVVSTLEAGGTSLTESLALWEKGEELAAICQTALEGARARMDAALQAEGQVDGHEEEPG